jgi:hypothetical protein
MARRWVQLTPEAVQIHTQRRVVITVLARFRVDYTVSP